MVVEILSFRINWDWPGQIETEGHSTHIPHLIALVTLTHWETHKVAWFKFSQEQEKPLQLVWLMKAAWLLGSGNPEDPAMVTVSAADKNTEWNFCPAPVEAQNPKVLKQSHVLRFKCLFSFEKQLLAYCWALVETECLTMELKVQFHHGYSLWAGYYLFFFFNIFIGV